MIYGIFMLLLKDVNVQRMILNYKEKKLELYLSASYYFNVPTIELSPILDVHIVVSICVVLTHQVAVRYFL